ncbi:hypothetical protein AUK40_06460 [Candidatus Wirthbacteria bacterium CG2_30_54_11]|uniref:Serine aminopeptidase S33 domain-containing protein n=1 Tax=Candidatus Wirthbacteria bacterium CG2_30_54_11 TaxID=1817892 RepID=A0A1J5IP58_9BACT|nr:MAG: hypothetical protein AUK40_06460 [Candidatus Wirthbacteria bacterium CG2_30_54_11]
MQTKWLRTLSKDKVELHGLLFEPDVRSDTIVLHFHGKEGNFITNRFVYSMSERFTAEGIAFLTVNQRCHDYMSESLVQTPAGFEFKRYGFALDVFEDCLKDIEPFVDLAISHGYRRIYLQGHSLPHRCIYYHIQTHDDRITGLINICCSDLLFEFNAYVENYEDNLKLAKALVESGQGDRIMPILMWAGAYASAKTFWSYGNPEGNAQIFSFSDPKSTYDTLHQVKIPSLYVEPETDFSFGIDPHEALQICAEHTTGAPTETLHIPNTSHSFINAESELCDGIVKWIKKQ